MAALSGGARRALLAADVSTKCTSRSTSATPDWRIEPPTVRVVKSRQPRLILCCVLLVTAGKVDHSRKLQLGSVRAMPSAERRRSRLRMGSGSFKCPEWPSGDFFGMQFHTPERFFPGAAQLCIKNSFAASLTGRVNRFRVVRGYNVLNSTHYSPAARFNDNLYVQVQFGWNCSRHPFDDCRWKVCLGAGQPRREWAMTLDEDEPERLPGPEIGDYLGIPINAATPTR